MLIQSQNCTIVSVAFRSLCNKLEQVVHSLLCMNELKYVSDRAPFIHTSPPRTNIPSEFMYAVKFTTLAGARGYDTFWLTCGMYLIQTTSRNIVHST